jgi:hypothetical protein
MRNRRAPGRQRARRREAGVRGRGEKVRASRRVKRENVTEDENSATRATRNVATRTKEN